MGTFTYWHELGRYRERTYYLGIRADPSLNDVQSFAVVLYYERPEGGSVEVAKIDNSSHDEGDIHVDRYYRELSAPRKDFDADFLTLPRPSDSSARTGGGSRPCTTAPTADARI